MVALVVGATGLVGRMVTEELLGREELEEVRVLVRRIPDVAHPKLLPILVEWDQLDRYSEAFSGVHSVYCCLGTTIKKAGSQQQFRKVDVDYVIKTAELAKRQGVRQFMAVSSAGANPKVRNFYLRTKGEVEEKLAGIGFRGLHLFRPSLLLGERPERRFGERVASVLMTSLDFAFKGPKLAPYRAIPARKVAKSMVNIGLTDMKGHHVYTNEVIHVLGEAAD
ncbi:MULTISPECIES: NAD(P)H-binding protein [Paenibacillus]|uniref:Nucleoside-diphosphate sugar epimerase n=1 Tax=Paenibacillus lautus TaxID=1401 RepID=A0A1R1ATC2_PAELA|nr:NAD(P)H-binding protein [Paenibacillus lautus]OME88804.1 nucleoside-diphosphate sugar epimerase [Paenibacillus lautus]